MTAATTIAGEVRQASAWRTHLLALGAVVALLLLLFHRDALDMVTIWWTASTFGHCLFIPPLIGWLVHQRLPGLRQLDPQAWAPGLVWLGAGSLLWVMGEAAGFALFRHAGVVVMLQGAVIALLGAPVARALTFPLFYAFFSIPFGEEVVPLLQLVTARLAMAMLALVRVPAHLDGIFITTPTGYFEVAEACSGAMFLIAMAAYGVLVANVCFRSWPRRIIFVGAALALSIIANGVRAFATIWVAHLTSVDAAIGFDHVVYGWVFFAIVMAVVMAAAWPFFDRKPGDPWFDPRVLQGARRGWAQLGYVAPAALALAALAPLWLGITASAAQPVPPLALPQVPGWEWTDTPQLYPWKARFDGADGLAQGRYRDGRGEVVDLVVAVYARQQEGRELVGFGQGAVDPDSEWAWSSPAPAPDNARGQQITAPGPVVRDVVTFYSVGGVVTGSAGAVKLQTLKGRLLGTDQRAVAILVSAERRDGFPPQRAIAAFLRDFGPIKEVADAHAGIR